MVSVMTDPMAPGLILQMLMHTIDVKLLLFADIISTEILV